MLHITAGCTEIYDTRFLPGMQRTNILNFDKPDIHQAISAPDCYYWLRPDKVMQE